MKMNWNVALHGGQPVGIQSPVHDQDGLPQRRVAVRVEDPSPHKGERPTPRPKPS